MSSVLSKQMKQIEFREEKFFSPKTDNFITEKVNPVINKLSSNIPKKVKNALDNAFYKGFELVFEKGIGVIEKTYNKEKILFDYDVNDYALNKKLVPKYLKRIDRVSLCSNLINTSFSALEGGVLGLAGIGLADIPLFLSVIIKAINEVSLSYGFDYNKDEEKSYILTLISCALARSEEQLALNERLDKLSSYIDNTKYNKKDTDTTKESLKSKINTRSVEFIDIKEDMKEASSILSDVLLTAKFIQGIPLVGVVGGIVNLNVMTKVTQLAKIKYKKRYLLKKEQGNNDN